MVTDVEVRRRTTGIRRSDLVAIISSAAAATSVTGVLFGYIAPLSGLLGFVVVAYVLFLVTYAIMVSLDEDGPTVRDRVVTVVVYSLALLVLTALIFILAYVCWRGWRALTHFNFFTTDISEAGPLQPLSVGGILHGVIGSLEELAMTLAICVPLGLTCALFLSEVRGPFATFVRTVVEAMTALPSIVAGMFVFAVWIILLKFDKSGLAASIALGVMMLPIVVRAADVVLRLVPAALKEASFALGAGQVRTVWKVVLPTARSGLATAVILGSARAIGETSPVLLTAGYGANTNLNPLKGPMVSLPLLTFELVKSPQPTMIIRAFGTAVVLLVLVLLLFIIARLIGGGQAGDLTVRQLRARMRASRRDLDRMTTQPAESDDYTDYTDYAEEAP
jgi:phosphate transport system permease protein